METVRKKIGKNLKKARINNGLSVIELSAMLRLTRQTVSKHEKGKGLTLERIEEYCVILNVSCEDILNLK